MCFSRAIFVAYASGTAKYDHVEALYPRKSTGPLGQQALLGNFLFVRGRQVHSPIFYFAVTNSFRNLLLFKSLKIHTVIGAMLLFVSARVTPSTQIIQAFEFKPAKKFQMSNIFYKYLLQYQENIIPFSYNTVLASLH